LIGRLIALGATLSFALPACSGGGSSVPSAQKPAQTAAAKTLESDPNFGTTRVLDSGYRVTLTGGGALYYPSTAQVTQRTLKNGEFIAVNASNAQDVFPVKQVRSLELRAPGSGSFKPYSAVKRSPQYINGNCDASSMYCPVCPDCSGPTAGPGGETDQLNCIYLNMCGDDPFGNPYGWIRFGGIASIIGVDGFNCDWNADTGDLNCYTAMDGWEPPRFSTYTYRYPGDPGNVKPDCTFAVTLPSAHPRYTTFAGYRDQDSGAIRARIGSTAAGLRLDSRLWTACNPNSQVTNTYYNGVWLAGGAGAIGAQPG
jgi:hypothetical protein